jgi:hypothetical protein
MKCAVCGYEQINKDEDKFIEIEGEFTRKKDTGYTPVKVYLYSCPKCKIVQMDE